MQAAIKGTILVEGEEKRKERKTWKRSEKKVMGFSSASLFPSRKQEGVTQGRTRGIEHQCGGEPREPIPSKDGRTSKTAGTFKIYSS